MELNVVASGPEISSGSIDGAQDLLGVVNCYNGLALDLSGSVSFVGCGRLYCAQDAEPAGVGGANYEGGLSPKRKYAEQRASPAGSRSLTIYVHIHIFT
jgi:hypothetical protein